MTPQPSTYPGLTTNEVAERLKRGESNHFKARVGRGYWEIFRDNVLNLFNIVFFILLVVVIAMRDYSTAVFAGFSVVTNSILGMFQEISAKRKLDQLAALTAHTVSVYRDGQLTAIPISQIVKDDILPIEPGDRIVVDGRVLQSDALEIDESQLTGESDAVFKEADSEIQSGSFCIAGTGVMVATRVGRNSTINTLSTIAKVYKNVQTPTQQRISAMVQVSLVVMLILMPMLFVASARRQAVTRVNAEQASKSITWEPTRIDRGEGRCGLERTSDTSRQSRRGSGDGMHDREIDRNTGSPRDEGVTSTDTP